MLYVDISALASYRGNICVSIYLRTTPVTQEAQADRIALKNLAKDAIQQLRAIRTDKQHLALIAEQFDDLIDDDHFWRFQAHSLVLFATPPNYGLVDEIASRVLATAGRVLGVRKADIPRGAALAAILRYPA